MKLSKKNTINVICYAAFLLLGVVAMILQIAVENFNLFSHPIFAFLYVFFVGACLLNLINGFIYKSPVSFALFAISLLYVLTYSLIDFAHLAWWAILIIDVVELIFAVIASLLTVGNKTESIALNESVEYKNYKQRNEERNKTENEQKKELPEIKSFKNQDNK